MLANIAAAQCSRKTILVLAAVATFLVLGSTLLTLQSDEYGRRASKAIHQAVDSVQEVTRPHQVKKPPIGIGQPSYDQSDAYCKEFPDPGNIAVILKTGATELYEKVPMQLATSLRCVHQPIILSDLEQTLGDIKVHDVLSNVSPSAMEDNTDFNIYRLQQEYVATGRKNELPSLSKLPNNSTDWRTEGKSAAWELDKYKFLHMIERSWALAPNRDWYLFIEADTYLSWPNLLSWLPTLDATQDHYFGNAIQMHEYSATKLFFGHGGSGILLSGPVVRAFASKTPSIARKWDKRVHKMWFGDFVLAAALYEELSIRITQGQPSMTGNEPETQAFLPSMWCRPVITVHHVDMQHTNSLYQFEKSNISSSPLLWRDVYTAAFPHGMPSNHSDWDNISGDDVYALKPGPTEAESKSYEACELACSKNEKCFQFMYTEKWTKKGEVPVPERWCHHSRAIILGKQRPPRIGQDGPDSVQNWRSGWMRERIADWVRENRQCPGGEVEWPG